MMFTFYCDDFYSIYLMKVYKAHSCLIQWEDWFLEDKK